MTNRRKSYVIPVSPPMSPEVCGPQPAPKGLKNPNGLISDGGDHFVKTKKPEEARETIEDVLYGQAERDFQNLIAAGRKPCRLGFEKAELGGDS